MSQQDAEFWARVRRARDKLIAQFIYHPDISLIDIGYASERGEEGGEIALRIHVREQWTKAQPEQKAVFPEQVEGIPVIVMVGDYGPEPDAPTASG